jgi:hypothetical protein
MGQAKLFKRLRREALVDFVPIQKRQYSKGATGTMINVDPARQEYQKLKTAALKKHEPTRKAWPVSLTKLRRCARNVSEAYACAPEFPGKLRSRYG